MNELLHRDPGAPLPPPTRDLVLPDTADADATTGLEAGAVTARSEIQGRALARAGRGRSRTVRAERESYPDVTVSTSYASMWAMPEHRWMVSLGFNLPFASGRRAGAVDEASAARARYESEALRLADKGADGAWRSLREAAAGRRFNTSFVSTRKRLLPIARDEVDVRPVAPEFVASRNDFVAVVGAERDLRSVELGYQMARADVDRREAELERAVGAIPGLDPTGGSR